MAGDDDCSPSDYEDAVIEDTVRCCLCNASFTLGGNDGIILDNADRKLNSAVCIECAAEVHREYEQFLRESCICEHGAADGEWCEPCNAEYKRAEARFRAEEGGD